MTPVRRIHRVHRREFAQSHKALAPPSPRRGLSLLEVMISMAILAMATAMLWQITNQATNNASGAQRLTRAQILGESVMAEILAGAIPLEPLDWTLDESGSVPGEWYYRLETSTGERENMIGIRLSISDNPERTDGNPETFFIVRYAIDPQLGLDTPQVPIESDASNSSGALTGNSSSSGSATTGGGC